jgi:hypothetical protein
MKKRVAALTAVLVFSVVTFAMAFASGTYKGKTSQGRSITLKATQTKITDTKVTTKFKCTDGDRFTTEVDLGSQSIKSDGRYGSAFVGNGGATRFTNKGRIVRRTATGTFTAVARYDAQNNLAPNGSIKCTSGTVRYSIKHV